MKAPKLPIERLPHVRSALRSLERQHPGLLEVLRRPGQLWHAPGQSIDAIGLGLPEAIPRAELLPATCDHQGNPFELPQGHRLLMEPSSLITLSLRAQPIGSPQAPLMDQLLEAEIMRQAEQGKLLAAGANQARETRAMLELLAFASLEDHLHAGIKAKSEGSQRPPDPDREMSVFTSWKHDMVGLLASRSAAEIKEEEDLFCEANRRRKVSDSALALWEAAASKEQHLLLDQRKHQAEVKRWTRESLGTIRRWALDQRSERLLCCEFRHEKILGERARITIIEGWTGPRPRSILLQSPSVELNSQDAPHSKERGRKV